MRGERIVAGFACSAVLARLSDYLDGELAPDERAQLEAHVRGCDHCARFGGVFADLIRTLRHHLTHTSHTSHTSHSSHSSHSSHTSQPTQPTQPAQPAQPANPTHLTNPSTRVRHLLAHLDDPA